MLAAFLNWRHGMYLCILTGFVQDPVRKLLPGQPVVLTVFVAGLFAAGLVGGSLPGAHERVVGPRERDPVDEHQQAGVAGDVQPLPERERAEERGVRVGDELSGQLGQLGVTLREGGQVRQRLADVLGGGLRGTAAGEQPEGAAVGGVDQLGDLVEVRLRQAVATGGREVAGDVEDRLLAVVER